eukprot:g57631.t1
MATFFHISATSGLKRALNKLFLMLLLFLLMSDFAVWQVEAGARPAPWSKHYNHDWRKGLGPRKKKFANGQLKVHLIPHTHDDVGWLKTVDQYYTGQNRSIQTAAVQYILSNVLQQLLEDSSRTFVYVEQAFFQRWWDEQSEEVQQQMRDVVSSGQLEFLNGGWCMHDEASTHYIGMIDQTTLGHRFLKEEFGVIPRIGWQIDPFGHTATQAALLSAETGFDALFFGRIDYQDREARTNTSRLEFIWSASPSLGSSADVFTSSYYTGNYGPPVNFCFDDIHCDDVIQDDPNLEDYNVDWMVESFVDQILDVAEFTHGNDIMIDMGSDFHYQNALSWFSNIDKLIKYVNADGRLDVFYSTPSRYVKAKLNSDIAWTVKYDDFMPYSDCENCMWSGYFTSRPALKRFERVGSQFLQATRQVSVWCDIAMGVAPARRRSGRDKKAAEGGSGRDGLTALWKAHGVLQHHDGVSGTSKQHVAYDYAKRLSAGMAQVQVRKAIVQRL